MFRGAGCVDFQMTPRERILARATRGVGLMFLATLNVVKSLLDVSLCST